MLKKFIPLLMMGGGVFLLIQVVMPFVSYKFWELTTYNDNLALASPDAIHSVQGISVRNLNSFPALFSDKTRVIPPSYSSFFLSIPSIKLDNAQVLVDTNEFDQNLALMPGTALPGERGNVFITGHSSLPQFYRPGNYKAIFALLPEVKKGDQIFIDAGGQKFEYIVKGLKIVDPKETWVINPPDNAGRYLSLMTCVPPGLYLKRLIVLAELK